MECTFEAVKKSMISHVLFSKSVPINSNFNSFKILFRSSNFADSISKSYEYLFALIICLRVLFSFPENFKNKLSRSLDLNISIESVVGSLSKKSIVAL